MISNIPTHVAIVPDGNRRWAKEHGVPPLQGHSAGAEAMHNVVEHLINRQVKYLTVWGFSMDNWKRSENEVQNIFNILGIWIEKDTPWLKERGVKLCFIGHLHGLPPELQDEIMMAEDLTKQNLRMTLNIALNYTGRSEIVAAVRQLIADNYPLHLLDEPTFSRYLYTGGMPDVDLVIRTAGEFRLSNFLLWQIAYSELYFTKTLWPDFGVEELEKALRAYIERQRRFGGD